MKIKFVFRVSAVRFIETCPNEEVVEFSGGRISSETSHKTGLLRQRTFLLLFLELSLNHLYTLDMYFFITFEPLPT